MSKLVIVAIPSEQDRIWKLSSEKVPHLTLLFLGEAEASEIGKIVLFLQHAASLSEHGPFYLDVERRGELGDDQADVLFFNKRSWNLKWIKSFRSQLLQNEAVRKAYDSTEQYPEWNPHLTLGYPETPAKTDGEDRSTYSVEFDRIAIWTGDFDGPEFRLEWPEREDDMGLAYHEAGQAAVADILGYKEKPRVEELIQASLSDSEALQHFSEAGKQFVVEHYGTKGMRWGVRNNSPSVTPTPAPVTTQAVVNPSPKKGRQTTAISTSGGQFHKPAADAIKAAESKQKLRKSGPAALSNEELANLNHRMNLERSAVLLGATAPPTRMDKAKRYVAEQFTSTAKRQADRAINDLAAQEIKKMTQN